MAAFLSPILNAAILLGAHLLAGLSVIRHPTLVLLVASAALILFHLGSIRKNVLVSVWAIMEALMVGFILFYLFAFIFGALLLKSWRANSAWSLWMSALTALPTTRKLGRLCGNKASWCRVFRSQAFLTVDETMLFFSVLGAIIGSWLGCAVIPLDWGRAWQKWPVPNVMAASICSLLGLLIGGVIGGGRGMPVVEVQPRRLSPVKKKEAGTQTATNGKSPTKTKSRPSARSRSPRRRAPSSPDKTAAEPKSPRTPRRSSGAAKSEERQAKSVSRTPRKATSREGTSPRRTARRE